MSEIDPDALIRNLCALTAPAEHLDKQLSDYFRCSHPAAWTRSVESATNLLRHLPGGRDNWMWLVRSHEGTDRRRPLGLGHTAYASLWLRDATGIACGRYGNHPASTLCATILVAHLGMGSNETT